MAFSTPARRRIAIGALAAACAATAVPSAEAGARTPSRIYAGLPGCATTLIPDNRHPEHATCLEASAHSGADVADSTVQIAENAPWPGEGGWVFIVNGAGEHNLPGDKNDAASSWISHGACGNFYVNNAGTLPWQPYPNNSVGNFPYGVVGNDQLTAVSIIGSCA